MSWRRLPGGRLCAETANRAYDAEGDNRWLHHEATHSSAEDPRSQYRRSSRSFLRNRWRSSILPSALQDRLSRQDLFEEFCDEFTEKINRPDAATFSDHCGPARTRAPRRASKKVGPSDYRPVCPPRK